MNEIIVAAFAFLGTLVGSLGGIVASARLTNYRLKQLEAKVDKHNNFAERIPVLEERIKVSEHRISDLEEAEKKAG